ncbi:uncharacterized protein LOC6543048 [Drosophila erecta]|uniref:Uncharacterized protein n=1 Tax=Drosophila erecta TaxID=7220 RepID=B3N7E1_DROER|nr:uncharacterized protein LOC6543048 [Drosophila erecta]EDV58292.1 uncharacterized protein Dere_GG25302 [Drosophila erecta]
MPDIENQDAMGLGKFIAWTLLALVICLLGAIPQWMVLCLFGRDALIYTIACFFVAFVVLVCMHLIELLKYWRPYNYVAMFVCYELLTLGTASFLMNWRLSWAIAVMGVALLFLGIALLICLLLIYTGLYMNPFKLAVVGGMLFVLAFCIEIMNVFLCWWYWQDVAIGVFFVSVATLVISHVLITYLSFGFLGRDDCLLVAIVLYIAYILFLIACRLSAFYIEENHSITATSSKFGASNPGHADEEFS